MFSKYANIASIVLALFLSGSAAGLEEKPTPQSVLWRYPGKVEMLDLGWRKGGPVPAPREPFAFLEELWSGTSSKVKVRDGVGRNWVVKWGPEVKSDIVASRLVWACGYFVPPSYYVKSGKIERAQDLDRAGKHIDSEGNFERARFQLWEPGFLKRNNWTWDHNPFAGSRELAGLKILMMLTSNWDNKDATYRGRHGFNTAIIEHTDGGVIEYRYLVCDWGASMGKWGFPLFRKKWNCEDYSKQNEDLVQEVKNGVIESGYRGYVSLGEDIQIKDVRWLMQYLGRISRSQIHAALEASGATPDEITCYTAAILARIDQLRAIARQTE
jgi:hypothetical protein